MFTTSNERKVLCFFFNNESVTRLRGVVAKVRSPKLLVLDVGCISKSRELRQIEVPTNNESKRSLRGF